MKKPIKEMKLRVKLPRKKQTPMEEAIMFLADCIESGSWQNTRITAWNILNGK